jgi:hypothetical protein
MRLFFGGDHTRAPPAIQKPLGRNHDEDCPEDDQEQQYEKPNGHGKLDHVLNQEGGSSHCGPADDIGLWTDGDL